MALNAGSLVRYKFGKSALHKAPAWAKLVALCALSLVIFLAPRLGIAVGIVIAAYFAWLTGFSFREQARDLRPLLFYATFLYISALVSNLVSAVPLPALLLPSEVTLTTLLRLTLLFQLSTLFFRTTTLIALKEAIALIEDTLRAGLSCIPLVKRLVSREARFARILSLFLGFIPAVFEQWAAIDLAWRARSGKDGVKKALVLLPLLLSRNFYDAAKKARALAARS
jgi:energy-coupling factor transporter transmembrane protein EcfT